MSRLRLKEVNLSRTQEWNSRAGVQTVGQNGSECVRTGEAGAMVPCSLVPIAALLQRTMLTWGIFSCSIVCLTEDRE